MILRELERQERVRVGICIPTFRRNELLRQLLLGISKQRFERMPEPEIVVVVVDNDPAGIAAETCRAASLPWPMKYVVEARRGIAQARNRAILEADHPDFIVFIDDDEVPVQLWLEEMLWTQRSFGSDVVCGPVFPRFAPGTPEWVKAGGFFSRPIDTTGHAVGSCYSGNVLIARRVMNKVPAFDERFALTGGEDTHFFLRVRRAGFQIVGSAEAVVYETVPISRACLSWVLRRAYQSGNCWVLCESILDRRLTTRIVRTCKACTRVIQGAVSACVSPLFGKTALALALRNLFLGAGMLAALAGRTFQGYQSAGTDAVK